MRGVVDLFTDDGVLMEPEQDTAVGRQQLEASYERAFATLALDRTFHVDRIELDAFVTYDARQADAARALRLTVAAPA